MPDMLAHALIAYTVCRLVSLRIGWFTTPYVTAGMAGAFIPDLLKVKHLVSDATMESLLGVPFSWGALQTFGGATLCVLVGVVLVPPGERRRVGTALSVGAATHMVSDAMLLTATGRSFPVLWPLTSYVPPTPGLYLSTEPGPTVVAAVAAGIAWLAARRASAR
ncbi:metal-dependent hydrolase [Halobacteriales archaeon QS_8_69_26]|nr:MAG: metal-dependent hydrolase [Halobacteriales archaeon QS_8_69_26]